MNHLRFALRQFAKAPGFTAIAIATLALGIGASSAVFSVVETFLLRPLPYRAPQQLVSVQCEQPGLGRTNVGTSVPELEDLRDRAGAFAEISMVFPMNGNLTGVAQPQRVEAMAVSPNFFRLLGASPLLGRTFGPEEEKVTGWAEGCVLSYAAWQKYFGGDPGALERKIWLDYDTYRIVGVMPPGFRHPGRTLSTDADVWFTGGMRAAPFTAVPQRARRNIPGMIARLADGLDAAGAQARLEDFAAGLRRQFPGDYPADGRWAPRIQPLQRSLVGEVRPVLWLLFGAVSLVLLICCATLANLLLVRASGRRQELAVRCALGASRGAVMRQLLTESLLLAFAGGLGGLVLAWWLPPLIVELAPVSLPRVNDLTINGNVLAFAFAVSAATGVAFGLVPAWQAVRFDLVSSLKEGSRDGGVGRGAQRLRAGFAAAQVALSLMLLAGGGLLLKSLWQALQTDPGFRPDNLVVAGLWLPPPSDPKARQTYRSQPNRNLLVREMQRRLHALPGVEDVAVGTGQCVPFAAEWNTAAFTVEDANTGSGAAPAAVFSSVSPGYFRTLGVRLLRGRAFTEGDDGDNRVVLVNQAAARRYWPDADPVGRRIATGPANAPAWWTVVGVVANVKTAGLDTADAPQIYQSVYQRSGMSVAVFLRATGSAATLAGPLRREIQAIDKDLPVFAVRPMDDVMARSLAQRRFATVIVGAFATVALLLAGLGVYGVVALTVAQRTREIGVRVALGAERRHIVSLVLRQGARVMLAGVVAGLAGAAAMTRVLRAMLFETSPVDPFTFATVVAVLVAVALLACWLPARRATRVSPAVALRSE